MNAHAESDHHDHHHHGPITDWPLDPQMGKASPGKIAMWFFLLSDAMSFGGLLLAYAILRARADVWIQPGEPAEFGLVFTGALTFLLILSSVSMVLAVYYAKAGDKKLTSKWLLITGIGGALFLCGQMQEYFGAFSFIFGHAGGLTGYGQDCASAAIECLPFGDSARASTFYIITAFHGLHVLTGTIYIFCTLIANMKGKYENGNYSPVEICGLFWHFVDLVWILVFTFIYLIPIPEVG